MSENGQNMSALNDTQSRSTLLVCAELLGGMAALARHLNVSEQHLAEWVAGRSSPPPDIISKALDLVIAATRPGA